MAKQYRVNAFVRINNLIISSLLRLGIRMGVLRCSQFAGVKVASRLRPPSRFLSREGKSYLLTPYGIVNWVRNLRAAGGEEHYRVVGILKRFVLSNYHLSSGTHLTRSGAFWPSRYSRCACSSVPYFLRPSILERHR